jgi:hypothetical protein
MAQVVLNATTLGRVLLDATDKHNRNASKIGRKLGSALRALTGTEVLKDWIQEQVNMSRHILIEVTVTVLTCVHMNRSTTRFLLPTIPVGNRKSKGLLIFVALLSLVLITPTFDVVQTN